MREPAPILTDHRMGFTNGGNQWSGLARSQGWRTDLQVFVCKNSSILPLWWYKVGLLQDEKDRETQ